MKKNIKRLTGLLALAGGLVFLVACQNDGGEVVENKPEFEDFEKLEKEILLDGEKTIVKGYKIDGKEYYQYEDIIGKSDSGRVEETKTSTSTPKGESVNKADLSDYRDFELEIDYPDNEIDIEYEVKGSIIESKYEDKKAGRKIKGPEAERIIEDKLLGLNYSLSEEEVITSVLKSLGLGSNYTKFDLEIDYIDGRKIEIKRRK